MKTGERVKTSRKGSQSAAGSNKGQIMNAKDKKEISDIAAEIRAFCEKRWAGYTKVRLKQDVRSFAERLEALCNK